MKYAVILGDGMADWPLEELCGKTPLEAANIPNMDYLAQKGTLGLAQTLFEGMPTGSDVANMAVLGADPRKYYTGRSPIEALGLNIALEDNDTVFRMNLVNVSDETDLFGSTMIDYSAGKISNEEAWELVNAIRGLLSDEKISFYDGVSYRHIMIWKDIEYDYAMTPPHDISGKKIAPYRPSGRYGDKIADMMLKSHAMLKNHPVNIKRAAQGLLAANCIWLWGEGTKPGFESFAKRFGLNGSMITAVPLLQGLANGMELKNVCVEGATGDYHTNYIGKAEAAISELKKGADFVFVHIEAPDECGHDGDIKNKVASIEDIDRHIVGPVLDYLKASGEDFRILLMPDHATPIKAKTHTLDPVPYALYDSKQEQNNPQYRYDEKSAQAADNYVAEAFGIIETLVNK